MACGYTAADIPEGKSLRLHAYMALICRHLALIVVEDGEEFMPLDQGDKVKYQRLFGSKVCPYKELEVGECIGQG